MPHTLAELTDAALALPAKERAELVDRLGASLVDDLSSDTARAAQLAEVMRRREEWLAGKVQLIPGEQVMREARELCR